MFVCACFSSQNKIDDEAYTTPTLTRRHQEKIHDRTKRKIYIVKICIYNNRTRERKKTHTQRKYRYLSLMVCLRLCHNNIPFPEKNVISVLVSRNVD